MKTIGLIGGMSWESSAVYYDIINKEVKALKGGLHSAKLLMYSFDFDTIARCQHNNQWAELESILIDAAKRLERGGADFIILCTNTMHKLADGLEKSIKVPFVHIGDATGEAIQKKSMTKVGLLGTRFTMEEDFLKKRLLDSYTITTIIPTVAQRNIIHSIIYDELVKGIIREESRSAYLEIIQSLVEAGAEGVILGCTEIGMLITAQHTSIPLFDTTRLHATKAVQLSLAQEHTPIL